MEAIDNCPKWRTCTRTPATKSCPPPRSPSSHRKAKFSHKQRPDQDSSSIKTESTCGKHKRAVYLLARYVAGVSTRPISVLPTSQTILVSRKSMPEWGYLIALPIPLTLLLVRKFKKASCGSRRANQWYGLHLPIKETSLLPVCRSGAMP